MTDCRSSPDRAGAALQLALIVALTLGAAPTLAQPRAASSAASQPASRSAYLQARRLIKRGDAHYDARRFAQAIAEYRAAYRLLPLPDLLFNIAQAHRLAGQDAAAVTYYRRYLELPDGKARAAAKRHLLELSKRLPPPPDKPSPPAATDNSAPSAPQNEADSDAPRRTWIGPVVTAAGLAITALGAGLAGSALAERSELEDTCAPSCARSSWDGLPERHTAGVVLGIVGAAITVTGVVLWGLSSWRSLDDTVALRPGLDGAGFALRF